MSVVVKHGRRHSEWYSLKKEDSSQLVTLKEQPTGSRARKLCCYFIIKLDNNRNSTTVE